MLKEFLVNNLPFLGRYKRFAYAFVSNLLPRRESYSQHGEDVFIWELLKGYDLKRSIYVDVGANHPSNISNSYLLYRKGLQGVVIDPNEELIRLFRRFRKRDVALMIGCSDRNSVLKFSISKTPVISSFNSSRDAKVLRSIYVPVMRLDDALSAITFEFISLLSIDVEGLNYEVLTGAKHVVTKSLLICIEFDSSNEIDEYSRILGDDFEIVYEVGCNVIFINRSLGTKLKSRVIA